MSAAEMIQSRKKRGVRETFAGEASARFTAVNTARFFVLHCKLWKRAPSGVGPARRGGASSSRLPRPRCPRGGTFPAYGVAPGPQASCPGPPGLREAYRALRACGGAKARGSPAGRGHARSSQAAHGEPSPLPLSLARAHGLPGGPWARRGRSLGARAGRSAGGGASAPPGAGASAGWGLRTRCVGATHAHAHRGCDAPAAQEPQPQVDSPGAAAGHLVAAGQQVAAPGGQGSSRRRRCPGTHC